MALSQVTFKNAIVSNLELTDGKQTQIVTIFNSNEINFEDVIIGVNTAIERQAVNHGNIKSAQNTFSKIEHGTLKPFASYKRREFSTSKNSEYEAAI